MPPDAREPGRPSSAMREVYSDVFAEIMEDITLELCFKVHRALKLEYLPIDEYIVKDGQLILHDPTIEDHNPDFLAFAATSKKKTLLNCPHCKGKVGDTYFAPHLNKCMGLGSRQTKERSAKRTMQVYDSGDDDDDEDYSDSGRRKKRKPTKNTRRVSKPKKPTNVDLSQKCGVVSLKQKTMCQNTLKCSIHTDEQRREVRRTVLKSIPSEPDPNVHIDVDTVDEVSRSSSPSDFSLDSNNSSVLSIKNEDVCSTVEQPRLAPSYP